MVKARTKAAAEVSGAGGKEEVRPRLGPLSVGGGVKPSQNPSSADAGVAGTDSIAEDVGLL